MSTPHALREVLLVGLAVLGACAPSSLRVTLPPEVAEAGIGTLVVSLEHDGDRRTVLLELAAETPQGLLPGLPAWTDEEPATYTLLGYRSSPTELEVRPGLVDLARAEGASTTTLPPPALVLQAAVQDELTWRGVAVPEALSPLRVERATPPLDCDALVARPIALPSPSLDVRGVVATSTGTALLMVQGPGEPVGLAELSLDRSLVRRALPAEVDSLTTLATDGADVWATDRRNRLVLLDRRGVVQAVSEPEVMSGVSSGSQGGVFGFYGGTVYRVVPGSLRVEPLPASTLGPPSLTSLGSSWSERVAGLDRGQAWFLEDGRWIEVASPEALPEGRVIRVGADARGGYLMTRRTLYRRLPGRADLMPLEERDLEARDQLLIYDEERVVMAGYRGFVRVAPRGVSHGWCTVQGVPIREIERLSVDPSRRALFMADGLDADDTQTSAMVLYVPLIE